MKDKIFNSFKKIILKIANKKYPEVRRRKYSLEYYLQHFVYILSDIVHWRSLSLINNNNNSSYHWLGKFLIFQP